MPRLTALVLAALAGLASPALAQEGATERKLPDGTTLRADDLRRLTEVDRSYGEAVRQAMAGATLGDLDQLLAALRGAPMPLSEARSNMPGDWSCQMMKVGGGLPLTIYQPFACRADAEGGFQKLTGSQRTKGALFDWQDRLTYVGTGHVSDEAPVPYADLPEVVDTGASPQLMPEVGVVEMTGTNRGRIIFPDPYLESVMNVLVLQR